MTDGQWIIGLKAVSDEVLTVAKQQLNCVHLHYIPVNEQFISCELIMVNRSYVKPKASIIKKPKVVSIKVTK
jgi:hypothetical protein